jgi:RNA polymerase subunit RPABC4/transcription elongation factor Spt4
MGSWTCPNTKCAYDKQLLPEQHCPLCGEKAKEFNISELDSLWKQKWEYKKSIEKAKKQKSILGRRKYCPKCGSTNLNFLIFYRPSIWKCLDCGYEGALIVEDGMLAEEIHRRYQSNKGKRV